MPQVIDTDRPFMGCCYGLGILARHLGGEVSKERFGEPVGTSAGRESKHARAENIMLNC